MQNVRASRAQSKVSSAVQLRRCSTCAEFAIRVAARLSREVREVVAQRLLRLARKPDQPHRLHGFVLVIDFAGAITLPRPGAQHCGRMRAQIMPLSRRPGPPTRATSCSEGAHAARGDPAHARLEAAPDALREHQAAGAMRKPLPPCSNRPGALRTRPTCRVGDAGSEARAKGNRQPPGFRSAIGRMARRPGSRGTRASKRRVDAARLRAIAPPVSRRVGLPVSSLDGSSKRVRRSADRGWESLDGSRGQRSEETERESCPEFRAAHDPMECRR